MRGSHALGSLHAAAEPSAPPREACTAALHHLRTSADGLHALAVDKGSRPLP